MFLCMAIGYSVLSLITKLNHFEARHTLNASRNVKHPYPLQDVATDSISRCVTSPPTIRALSTTAISDMGISTDNGPLDMPPMFDHPFFKLLQEG